MNKIYDLSEFVNYIEASKYMNDLQQYALKFYSFKDNIKITALPSVDDFVKECFANGNILLTACKDIDIPSNFRDDIALFVDGRIYVSKYCGHLEWAYTIINERILKKEHRDFVFLQTQYIPKSYIMALNEEAKKYSWYISKEEQNKKSAPSSDETDKMNKYIEDLFSNRKCLSVTNIKCDKSLNYFSAYPDTDKYALFSDGLLLISNKSPKSKFWFENISKVYKDLEFKIELVPDYYITAIYSNLHKYQRCATDIYMEMLKKQAKKIKKELKVAHYEALEIVARSESWKDYKSINIENESIARYLISRLLQYTPDHSTEYYARIYQKYLKEKGGNND